MLLLEKIGYPFPEEPRADVYIVPLGDKAALQAAKIAQKLREANLSCLVEQTGRSLKAAMKYANTAGMDYTLILGDNELESGKWSLRHMKESAQSEIASAEELIKIVKNAKGIEA